MTSPKEETETVVQMINDRLSFFKIFCYSLELLLCWFMSEDGREKNREKDAEKKAKTQKEQSRNKTEM